ncbi:MAG: DUF899 domain-containing protein [Gammaproteobacteria bacterium]|nr:DUF899 domain-containing protein [Gammaproteobacteria bacterium]
MTTIVSDDEWLAARLDLLAQEKDLQRARDRLAAARRALPWCRVAKDYRFASERGEQTLAELFGDASQLLIYHFMYHPDWDEGCKSCSFWADGYDGVQAHLLARDTRLIAVSRGPLEKLLAYRERMGWTFPWVSSASNSFNRDFGVTFTQEEIDSGDADYNYRKTSRIGEEMPGLSVFRKQDGEIYHTYSTYSRGLDPFNTAYQLLDLTSKGRDEDELQYTMEWLRRRDEY